MSFFNSASKVRGLSRYGPALDGTSVARNDDAVSRSGAGRARQAGQGADRGRVGNKRLIQTPFKVSFFGRIPTSSRLRVARPCVRFGWHQKGRPQMVTLSGAFLDEGGSGYGRLGESPHQSVDTLGGDWGQGGQPRNPEYYDHENLLRLVERCSDGGGELP